ncbi:MAG: replication initiation protein [Sulfurovaceae bacterium]|nr:replication initiation protein [Sulfurovaceae bacterium]
MQEIIKQKNLIIPTENEVIKNRVFGTPTSKMTRHQKVAFTVMIKIAYDALNIDPTTRVFEFPTDRFFELMGISTVRKQSHLFTQTFIDDEGWQQDSEEYSLERTLKALVNKSIDMRFKDVDGKTYAVESTALISYFKLTRKKVIFEFSEWVRHKIFITDNSYIMKLPIIATFDGVHTVTLFEQVEQRRDFCRWEVSVNTLKQIFGLIDGEYAKFSDFRKWCLDKPRDEMNKKTNYTVAYDYVKKGKKIDKIIFTWYINKTSLMEFQNFIRTKFINQALAEIPSKDGTYHLIQVSADGLLYNARNPNINYTTTKAKALWRWMYENQHLLLMKEQAENLENFKESNFTKYYGCDLILDGEKYNNIVLIQPTSLKNKLKVKFYAGELLVMEEEDFIKSVII